MNFFNGSDDLLIIDQEGEASRARPILHELDARFCDQVLSGRSIDITITSPPYFDVKDYGVPGQIGLGQSYEAYLEDLARIFKKVLEATSDTGSLWVVIDTFRRKGELIPLPFDLAARLTAMGWHLKDIIIWKKERNLPWLQTGGTRSIFEYVLVLCKDVDNFKYYPDRVRDSRDVRGWWVRYPERYNPRGKSLEEVWNIDIPVQGSWGKKTPRHHCPFPREIVDRILRLSTDVGDIVFDPFAGTGSVLFESYILGREAVGCEINPVHIHAFEERISSVGHLPRVQGFEEASANEFERAIVDLRILKFARILLKQVRSELSESRICIIANHSDREPRKRFSIASADFRLVDMTGKLDSAELICRAENAAANRPLSKFGLDAELSASGGDSLHQVLSDAEYFGYTLANTHKFAQRFRFDPQAPKLPCAVVSPIGVAIDVPQD